jgi:Anaerobic dehydrogenases, typically selenocysteine-containing
VGISQDAWFTPDEEGTDINGTVNTLAPARPTPLVKGNPSHTNLVEVKLSDKGISGVCGNYKPERIVNFKQINNYV